MKLSLAVRTQRWLKLATSQSLALSLEEKSLSRGILGRSSARAAMCCAVMCLARTSAALKDCVEEEFVSALQALLEMIARSLDECL